MRDLLSSFYKVRTNAAEGAAATSAASLEEFAAMLPHGSGLDGDYYLSFGKQAKTIVIRTEWHAMNQDGYYCGWYPVVVVLDRIAGELSFRSVRVNERATNGVGDMLADMFSDVCREANGAKVAR